MSTITPQAFYKLGKDIYVGTHGYFIITQQITQGILLFATSIDNKLKAAKLRSFKRTYH